MTQVFVARTVRYEAGERIYHHGNHHPCRETGTIWYRHDKVYVNDVLMEGHRQVKERRVVVLGRDMRRNRIESMTCFRSSCVLGDQPEWLYQQQQPAEKELATV